MRLPRVDIDDGESRRSPADVARQGDLVAVRGEMAELRGEVHGLLPRLVTANLASAIGVAGLVLAAAHFA